MTSRSRVPDVGRRLAAARLQRGLSQATVTRRTGIAPSYLSRIERGKIHPTFRTVLTIAIAIGAPIEEIAAPVPRGGRPRGPCPVSAGGSCLLDLIRAETEPAGGDRAETYTPREIRLLRRFGSWLAGATTDRLKAMELFLDDLIRAAGRGEESSKIP